MNTESFWLEAAAPKLPPPTGDVNVDVLIVGGGITGITLGYLLKKAGKTVAIADKQDILQGETAHTTSHLTYVTDTRLNELVSRHGRQGAEAFWRAGWTAMQHIERIVSDLSISCDLKSAPGYLFAATDKDGPEERRSLEEDARLATEFGFDTEMVDDPLFHRPAIRFPNQLKFHPLKYGYALAKAIPGDGSHVFAKTDGSGIDAEKRELKTANGTIRFQTLVAATNMPIQGLWNTASAALFQTKLAAYSTYAIAAEIPSPPVADSLFWDTNDPYYYWRFDHRSDGDILILGGEDHKTGQVVDTTARYEKLESILKTTLPGARVLARWSGQVVETPDGLPYIGQVTDGQYVATGYSGNGITLGTFAAILLRDLITGKSNAWAELFDPRRKRLGAAWEYIKENKDYPWHMACDWLAPAGSPEDVARGTGDVVRIDGKRRALYVDEHGKKTALSPVCPHMGCIVHWNNAEKTWDCPCHGSRFTATGAVMAGPAESDLEKVEDAV